MPSSGNVTAPSLQARTHIESAAIVKGIRRDGQSKGFRLGRAQSGRLFIANHT